MALQRSTGFLAALVILAICVVGAVGVSAANASAAGGRTTAKYYTFPDPWATCSSGSMTAEGEIGYRWPATGMPDAFSFIKGWTNLSYPRCIQYCINNDRCATFTYQISKKKCFLYSDNSNCYDANGHLPSNNEDGRACREFNDRQVPATGYVAGEIHCTDNDYAR